MEGIDVYHFLSGAFCQCVSIAKVVNFYVFDVVTICDIHVTIECCCARRARRFSGALLKLANTNLSYGRNFLTERIGGTSTCCIPRFAWIWALIRAAAAATRVSVSKIREGSGGAEWTMGLPAAAAGSGFGSFAGSTGGLSVDLLADGGLLLLQRSSRREENW